MTWRIQVSHSLTYNKWHHYSTDTQSTRLNEPFKSSLTETQQKHINVHLTAGGIFAIPLCRSCVSKQNSVNKPLAFGWGNLTGCSCQASTSNEPSWTKPFFISDRSTYLSALTTATSSMGKRKEGGQQHMVTVACNGMHAWGWNSHDLFKELMAHTTKMC